MKHIVKYFAIILASLISFIFVTIIIYNISLKDSSIASSLNNKYYNEAYKNIMNNCNNIITNNELKIVCDEIISKELIEKNCNELMNNIDTKNSTYDLFYNSINSKVPKESVQNKTNLSNKLTTSYINNIYPSDEVKLLKNRLPSIDTIYIISCFIILIIIVCANIIVDVNKWCFGYFISFVFIFSNIVRIVLYNIYYANSHFTIMINNYINNIFNIYLIIGILIFLITLFGNIYVIKHKKKKMII